jgi:hypothetical protein
MIQHTYTERKYAIAILIRIVSLKDAILNRGDGQNVLMDLKELYCEDVNWI